MPKKKKSKVTKRKVTKKIRRPLKRPKLKARKKIVKRKRIIAKIPGEDLIGRIVHYFPKVRAGVFKVAKGNINLGDRLHFKGHTTDFKQLITSMQINRVPIKQAKKGDEIGLLVDSRVRRRDLVYKIV